ncbi:MAG: MBL fold metallo-hydrolase [Candidatus Zixiibacteriota bacterium]
MKVTFLGTASGMPVIDRASSAILCEQDGQNILLDAGEGLTRRVLQAGLDLETISHIIISHTHPDHVAGLTTFLQLLHLKKRKSPIEIFLPQEAIQPAKSLFDLSFIWPERYSFDFNINQIEDGKKIDAGKFDIIPNLTTHLDGYAEDMRKHNMKRLDAFSFIIEAKKGRLLYSADIGRLSDLEKPLAAGKIGCMIIEGMHYEMENLPAFVDKFDIGDVYITHLPMPLSEFIPPAHSPKFKIARDLMTIEVKNG